MMIIPDAYVTRLEATGRVTTKHARPTGTTIGSSATSALSTETCNRGDVSKSSTVVTPPSGTLMIARERKAGSRVMVPHNKASSSSSSSSNNSNSSSISLPCHPYQQDYHRRTSQPKEDRMCFNRQSSSRQQIFRRQADHMSFNQHLINSRCNDQQEDLT